MSAATVTRSLNPDDDFILYGEPPHYTERTTFYPTKSDITTTTRNLSQHDYRADLYKDVLEDDRPLRSSLRNMYRILQGVSNKIAKTLAEKSTAKSLYKTHETGLEKSLEDIGTRTAYRLDDRKWLTDSEWHTASGHHVTFKNNIPTFNGVRPNLSLSSPDLNEQSFNSWNSASSLYQTRTSGGDDTGVPLTRFTSADLIASEYFPITMSCKSLDGEKKVEKRSRSQTRSPRRPTYSADGRPRGDQHPSSTDNYKAMRRLEKLYTVASEAPGIAASTIAFMSPYQEEMARLRLERLRLEEEHLMELKRVAELEKMRGPKPKWYELKDSQFHYEAQKNNELLRSQDRWKELMKEREMLTRTSPEFQKSVQQRSAIFA